MKSSPRRPKTKVFYFLLRLILAGLFLSTLLYMAGPFYIRFFLPLISYEIEILNPEYDIREFYLDDENQIMYQIRVDRVGFDHKGSALGGSEVKAGITGRTLYISPFILYSLLLAWPGLSIRDRFKAFLISVPLFIGTQLIDIPLDVINRVEAPWAVESLSGRIRGFWYYLLNNGGRQFLAFLVALLSIASVRVIFPSNIKAPVGRNDPCPCGSGKKFKKCCGK